MTVRTRYCACWRALTFDCCQGSCSPFRWHARRSGWDCRICLENWTICDLLDSALSSRQQIVKVVERHFAAGLRSSSACSSALATAAAAVSIVVIVTRPRRQQGPNSRTACVLLLLDGKCDQHPKGKHCRSTCSICSSSRHRLASASLSLALHSVHSLQVSFGT